MTGVNWQTVDGYFYGDFEVSSGSHTLDSPSLTFAAYVYSHTGFFGGYGFGLHAVGMSMLMYIHVSPWYIIYSFLHSLSL